MSLIYPADRAAFWAPKERSCFYCSDVVPEDAIGVIWVAESGLLLHPDCARSFGVHLVADSREAELASGRHPWTNRAGKALRSALVAEESRA